MRNLCSRVLLSVLSSLSSLPSIVPGLCPYFQPFYQPNECGKALCVRPDMMELDELYEFPEFSRDPTMYLALRNLVLAGGVTLSVIVSPVVAAVTVGTKKPLPSSTLTSTSYFLHKASQSPVYAPPHCVRACSTGIGVPIMLAYVYGVVPISLCRSGGCGVSAGNGKGVRIEFDDENDAYAGSGVGATGEYLLN